MSNRVTAALRKGLHVVAAAFTFAVYAIVVAPLARVLAWRRRRRGDPPRVLWGPIPLLTTAYLARASRLHGYASDSLVFHVYGNNARDEFDIALDRFDRIPFVGRLVPYATFLWAGLRYDGFGFFFDGGLLWASPFWSAELPLLKFAGKKVIVLPYGSDARLPSKTRAMDRWNAYTDVAEGAEDRRQEDVQAHLDAFGRWADVVLGNNDLVEDLPRLDGVMPYPIDLEDWAPVPEEDDGVVTVVHSSNHRHYKGTRFVIDAVEQLRGEGLPVELDIVEGVPLAEARARYATADVVAGDFLLGGYANFGVEAMALGKPLLSYLRPRTARFHPEWAQSPVVSAAPDEIADVLRQLVVDAERRRELGRRGPEFVREVHSLEAVGKTLDELYRRLWGPRSAGRVP